MAAAATPTAQQLQAITMNLKVLQRNDSTIVRIFDQSNRVDVFEFNQTTMKWNTLNIEGAMFMVQRTVKPTYGLCMLSRATNVNYMELIDASVSVVVEQGLVILRYPTYIRGFAFLAKEEITKFHNLFSMLTTEAGVAEVERQYGLVPPPASQNLPAHIQVPSPQKKTQDLPLSQLHIGTSASMALPVSTSTPVSGQTQRASETLAVLFQNGGTPLSSTPPAQALSYQPATIPSTPSKKLFFDETGALKVDIVPSNVMLPKLTSEMHLSIAQFRARLATLATSDTDFINAAYMRYTQGLLS